MNKIIILLVVLLLSSGTSAQSLSVVGKWKAIDDETGKPISVVEIFEKHNKIYGKVIDIFNPKSRKKVCEKCSGEDRDKPILGLVVIKGLSRNGEEYTNGKILDPNRGKYYKCTISLENKDKLKVRGFIGIELLGRTQFWERIKN